jgi:hypothetical protein
VLPVHVAPDGVHRGGKRAGASVSPVVNLQNLGMDGDGS